MVVIQIRRGERATRSPTRRHVPWVSSAPSSPRCGMPLPQPKIGGRQNARRPKIASSAGSNVSIESIATAMPIAPIGPMPEVALTSAIESASSAAITVMPEAKIAGPAVRSAIAQRLVLVLVLAQLLAVARHQQQRVVGARAEDEHGQDRRGLRR